MDAVKFCQDQFRPVRRYFERGFFSLPLLSPPLPSLPLSSLLSSPSLPLNPPPFPSVLSPYPSPPLLLPSSVLIAKRRDKFLARYKQFELDHNCFNL